MHFHTFDAEYIGRLRDRDPGTEQHFASYFGDLLLMKLRARLRSRQLAEDVRQETLMRVIQNVRRGNGIEYPERFGAFVNSVCNNVLREFCRQENRYGTGADSESDPADERINLDAPLITEDRIREVNRALAELPEKDRALLRMVFLEEKDKAEVCRQFQVDPDYLRVLLHRARSRFRKAYHPGA